MANRPTIERESFTTLDDVKDLWPAVADLSGNLFATWEWTSTWWHHFGASGSPMITVARDCDGRPAAIIPLYASARGPLRMLRFIGHGPSDWLGPIHAPDDAAAALAAMHGALADTSDWDVLLAQHIRSDQQWEPALDGTVLRREAFPILRFHERTWEQLLADRSANFRQQVRRRERQLARSYELRFRLCANSTQLDADMELLFKLHEARWAGGYSRAFTGHRQAFHLEFAHIALARRWLRLWVMELDSVPVAVWYGFRYAGVEWYYQAGRNPAYDSASVGFVLLCHTIRAALQDGASAYWFLRGSETYKGRFAEEDPGVETIAAARTARGRAAITIARHIDRAPVAARHYVRSRFG